MKAIIIPEEEINKLIDHMKLEIEARFNSLIINHKDGTDTLRFALDEAFRKVVWEIEQIRSELKK